MLEELVVVAILATLGLCSPVKTVGYSSGGTSTMSRDNLLILISGFFTAVIWLVISGLLCYNMVVIRIFYGW